MYGCLILKKETFGRLNEQNDLGKLWHARNGITFPPLAKRPRTIMLYIIYDDKRIYEHNAI